MIKQRFRGLLVAVFMAFLPVIVNAQFANEVKLLASERSLGDRFGSAISIDGDTAIIGEYQADDNGLNSGSAHIYVRDPVSGIWTEQAKLRPIDGAAADQFGRAVGISGDTAIVGAGFDDPNGLDSGSVYIFVRNPSTGNWSQQVKLLAADGVAGDRFGQSVSISGGTAVVGVYGHDEGGNNTGAAYVFERNTNTNTWSIAAQQKLLASDGANFAGFGWAVSVDGNTIVVGAYGVAVSGSGFGAAYIFERNVGTGIWSEQQKLLASDGAINDLFGSSVAVRGDVAIISSPRDDDNGLDSGSAYVFARNVGTGIWSEQQKLLASDGVANEQFSNSAVSIEGNTAIVGTGWHADNGDNSGAAYVFVRNSGTGVWSEQQKLLASDGTVSDGFGGAVAISGGTAIIGAQYDTDVIIQTGSVYVYTSSAGAMLPDITVTDSVAPAADLQIPFGNITELTTADQTVTITNDGSADLLLGTVGAANALAAPFSLLNDTCSSQTLSPAANCTLTVRFSPSSIGVSSDSFDIPSDDPDENPVTVNVSGSGVGVATPDIAVTDAIAPVGDLQVPFGNVTEMTNVDQLVTVTNVGNANLVIANVAMANALAAPFSLLNDTCSNQTLTPAANCTVTARFSPTTTGAVNDSFDIPSNDPDESSVSVAVSGTGTATPVPDITVTDAIAPASDLQIPFASLTVGGSNSQVVTIVNDGNADLVIGTIAQNDALTIPFSLLNDTCSGQTLAAAASCTFDARFAPTTAGVFNDSFDIPSNDADENPVTVNVSGRGLSGVNNPPSRPVLISPANGEVGLLGLVFLKWEPSTDPDGDTVTYDVYNCTNADPANNCTRRAVVAALSTPASSLPGSPAGNGIYYAGLGLGGGVVLLGFTFAGGLRGRKQTVMLIVVLAFAALLSSCNSSKDNHKLYVASGLSAGTTYYWTVIAKDGNGGETASAIWSYQTR